MKLFKIIACSFAAVLMLCGCAEKDEEIKQSLDVKVLSGEKAYVAVGSDYASIQFKVTPANVLSFDGAELFLVDAKGQISEDCVIEGMRSEADGIWDADVKFCSSGISSSEFMLELKYKDTFVKSRQVVTMQKVVLNITSLGSKGSEAEFDEAKSSFTLTLPAVTHFSSIVLDFKTTAETVMVGNTVLESGKTAVDLSKPLTIIAKSGDYSKEYSLTARNTGLPIVRIQTPGGRAITSKDIWLEGSLLSEKRSCAAGLSTSPQGEGLWPL